MGKFLFEMAFMAIAIIAGFLVTAPIVGLALVTIINYPRETFLAVGTVVFTFIAFLPGKL